MKRREGGGHRTEHTFPSCRRRRKPPATQRRPPAARLQAHVQCAGSCPQACCAPTTPASQTNVIQPLTSCDTPCFPCYSGPTTAQPLNVVEPRSSYLCVTCHYLNPTTHHKVTNECNMLHSHRPVRHIHDVTKPTHSSHIPMLLVRRRVAVANAAACANVAQKASPFYGRAAVACS